MLITSVVLNIVLLAIIAYCVWAIAELKTYSDMCQDRWTEWERRFYNVQRVLMDEQKLFLCIDGIRTKLSISSHRD